MRFELAILFALDLLGVAVFAISGCLAAGRKRLDWVGVTALAIVTSLGGGTIRDVLLNRKVFWIDEPIYLWTAIVATGLTIAFARSVRIPTRALLYADALGLALFSIVGAQIAEAEQSPAIVVILLGIITGVVGGVIRDVLTRDIPILFSSEETLYSVAALGGIIIYLVLQRVGIERGSAAVCGACFGAAIRFAAIIWNIRLPDFFIASR
jgi:uncharacterized membrane protein YeiH